MLQLRLEERRGVLIVTPLVARLDADVAVDFRDAVAGLARGRALVIVSLAHVATVDSSGLAAFVSVLKRMPPGAELRLVAVSPAVRALLARTRLDELFRPIEDAVSAFPS